MAMNKAIPDYFEKLVGYRSWSLQQVKGETLLAGYAQHIVWMPNQPIEAECRDAFGTIKSACTCPECGHTWNNHIAPMQNCSCGIHCFKDAVSYMKQLPPARRTPSNWEVHGVIKIWGKAIEHRSGYRAQFAEVALLCTRDTELCKKYGAEQFRGTFAELVNELQGGTL